MVTGPEAMPVFGDGTITPQEKRDIIAYITSTRAETNPGGFSLGRIGTVTRGDRRLAGRPGLPGADRAVADRPAQGTPLSVRVTTLSQEITDERD